MNYYKHHIGDYIRDTAHLTLLEDAIYRRLLDLYYMRECPLPDDATAVCRLIRAPGEVDAVKALLAEFFCLCSDGWRQKRADHEIAEAIAAGERSRENGKKGGRKPKGNPAGSQQVPENNPAGSQQVPENNPAGSQQVTSGVPRANPEESHPLPSTHNPINIPPSEDASAPIPINPKKPRQTTIPADFGISTRVQAWADEKGHRKLPARLEHFVSYAKRSGKRYADWDEAFMAAIREDWAKLNTPPDNSAPASVVREWSL